MEMGIILNNQVAGKLSNYLKNLFIYTNYFILFLHIILIQILIINITPIFFRVIYKTASILKSFLYCIFKQ